MQPDAPSRPERTFRMTRWVAGFLLAVTLGLAAVTVYFCRRDGLSLHCGTAAACTLFSFLGFADAFTTRVSLFSDSLTITSNLRRRTYPRQTLESVTWAWGCGVSVRLQNGRWVQLPDVGNAQSVTNSIRAWLKRTAERAPQG